MKFSILAILTILFNQAPSYAHTIRICVDDRPAPVTTPEGDGIGQKKIRRVAEKLGVGIEFFPVPWLRCEKGLRTHEYDAVAGKAATASTMELLKFPERRSDSDRRGILGTGRLSLVRKIGSPTNWDGTQFIKRSKPVLFPKGVVILREKLERLKVPGDESAKTLKQMLRMIQIGRAEVGIYSENDIKEIVRSKEFENMFEILPVNFLETDYYLAFTKAYYESNASEVEAFWGELGGL